MRRQFNVRLPDTTIRQLAELAERYESQAHVIILAIDRMYQQELGGTMSYSHRQHLIHALASQIDLLDEETIRARNKEGWTIDVRWQDGEYVSENDWTRVEGVTFTEEELQQAIDYARNPTGYES